MGVGVVIGPLVGGWLSADSLSRPFLAALRKTLFGRAGMLLLLVCLLSFGLTSFQAVGGLYVVDKFGFDTKQVGTVWMVMGAVTILVQGGLAGPLTRRLGELPLIYAGLVGGAVGFLGMSLAVGYPSTLVALSMGLNSAANSLGRVAGPIWAGYLYVVNIEYPYVSGAGVLLAGLLFCIVWLRPVPREGAAIRTPARRSS